MRTLRFAAAFWLIHATLVLRPAFALPALRATFSSFPELTLAALTLEMLPLVAGLASVVRWLRARASERRGAFATATRWATLLALAGLLLPLHARDAGGAASEIVYRAGQLVALLFLLDGPLAPEDE